MLAVVVLLVVHEKTNGLIAGLYGGYDAFHVRPIGMEVTFRTPVEERSGTRWAFISRASNGMTVLLAHVLLLLGRRFARPRGVFLKASVCYLTLLALLLDRLNLSIGPIIHGGDANGIAVGLGASRYPVQTVTFLALIANRELVTQVLLPTYRVKSEHISLRPWVQFTCGETRRSPDSA